MEPAKKPSSGKLLKKKKILAKDDSHKPKPPASKQEAGEHGADQEAARTPRMATAGAHGPAKKRKMSATPTRLFRDNLKVEEEAEEEFDLTKSLLTL